MMTFEDLYWMLSKDKTPAEIKEKLFSSASDDICRSFRSKIFDMTFGAMSDILMQNGYDLKQLPCSSYYQHYCWKIKLKNTTIRIMARKSGSNYVDVQIYYFLETSSSVPQSQINCDKFIESIRQADEMYPEILRVWESFEKEMNKFRKIREMSENSIETLVKERLRSTGIEYNLTLEPTYVLLKVKMNRGRYFEIKLPHNGFSDILTEEFVDVVNKVASFWDNIKYTCKIQEYENYINWFKSE